MKQVNALRNDEPFSLPYVFPRNVFVDFISVLEEHFLHRLRFSNQKLSILHPLLLMKATMQPVAAQVPLIRNQIHSRKISGKSMYMMSMNG